MIHDSRKILIWIRTPQTFKLDFQELQVKMCSLNSFFSGQNRLIPAFLSLLIIIVDPTCVKFHLSYKFVTTAGFFLVLLFGYDF